MAGREKKPALLKKQVPQIAQVKEGEPPSDTSAKTAAVKPDAPKPESGVTPVPAPDKPLKKKPAKKPINKKLKIAFKPKNKNAKKLKLSQSIFKTAKFGLDAKNTTLVKNGIKTKGKRKMKAKLPVSADDKGVPGLIGLPGVDNLVASLGTENLELVKKEPKKRAKKAAVTDGGEENKEKITSLEMPISSRETIDDIINQVASQLDLDIEELLKKPVKARKITKKPKLNAQKLPDLKPKKQIVKRKLVAPKTKKNLKSQTIIETLSKGVNIDSAAQNVINKLDLNVNKPVKKQIKKRRHSIEKFSTISDTQGLTGVEPSPFLQSPSTRRSDSPRSKRSSKIRQSSESIIAKRMSPYSTRSDSPARILRNGKHRKLKDSVLLEGIGSEYKKRRRLCSDYSGSEMSKFSGYQSESDSSFSDLTSLLENGAPDNMDVSPKEEAAAAGPTKSDLLKKEILDSIKGQPSTAPSPDPVMQNLNIKSISTKFTAILKRSLSTETSQLTISSDDEVKPKIGDALANFIDTNSNDVKPMHIKVEMSPTVKANPVLLGALNEIKFDVGEVKKEDDKTAVVEKIASSPSSKVPEKLLILDQMKQTFNESTDDQERRNTRSSVKKSLKLDDKHETVSVAKFYGSEKPQEAPVIENVQSIVADDQPTEEIKAVDEIVPVDEIAPVEEIAPVDERVPVDEIAPIDQNESETPVANDDVHITDAMIEEFNKNESIEDFDRNETVEELNNDEIIEEFNINETIEEFNKNETIEDFNQNETVEDESVAEDSLPVENVVNVDTENIVGDNSSTEEKLLQESTIEEDLPSSEIDEATMLRSPQEADPCPEIPIVEKVQEKMDVDENITEEQTRVEEIVDSTLLSKIVNANDDELIVETPENQAIKENILKALGLQSLKAAEEAKNKEKQKKDVKKDFKNDLYTGTLKTVIKLNRSTEKKKSRNPLKMTLQKSKTKNLKDGSVDGSKSENGDGKNDIENSYYKVMKEGAGNSGWRHGSNSSDTVGANRKSHYSNRSNMDNSSEHASDGDAPATEGEGAPGTKALVIPEKASSFSIHPGRLCSDECAYCFGKFGLFDTPLHIAQIKSAERQNKILENEIYVTRDSCLCDACYRHIDRRLNTPSYSNKSYKRSSVGTALPKPNHCHVNGCNRESSNVLRRKWLIKIKKNITPSVNIDLDNPGLHSIPVCTEHYTALERFMICAMCKRRLAHNHVHYLGPECTTLNVALKKESIPVTLVGKSVVCKLCRYFATLLLKPPGEQKASTSDFFVNYRKRLLHFHDVELMDEAETEEPIQVPVKEKPEKETMKKQRKGKLSKLNKSNSTESPNVESAENTDQPRVPSINENDESRASTPSDNLVDYETLVPNLSIECSSDVEEHRNEVPQNILFRKLQIPESVKEAVEISKIMKVKKNNVVDRLGSNPSISVRQLFPGEEDLPLQGNIDFNAVKERTPEGWEKCNCTIQYDTDTKHLWQELQKPYGNQSSFLRHLILLEKYFRNGDLVLSSNASHHAVNYSVSVQNRLRAYDNIPSNSLSMQPLTMLPFNTQSIKKSNSGIVTTKEPSLANLTAVMNAANLPKNTPIPISQLNPNLLNQLSIKQTKTQSLPPDLISLQPGTKRPVAPILNVPQKFRLPIGKNWRPTLIPVNQSKPQAGPEKKMSSGLVQVMSGGKPYHITMQDYNRMCHIKKSQDQKKGSDVNRQEQENSASSVLKPVIPRKNKGITVTAKPPNTSPVLNLQKNIDSGQIRTEMKLQQSSKSVMILPKIPKSLTVIPQTVTRKPSQAPSPTLSIISSKASTSKS